jgi:uncharacterized protein (DUF2147 family)
MKHILTVSLLALSCTLASAQTPVSATGAWRTIDDETKAEKSVVRITETAGVLSGKIEKVTDPKNQDAVCDKCEGAKKDQKIVGMTIVEGVKKNAEAAYFDGGTIVDPASGKVYKVRLTPSADGKTLSVRGSLGPFWRTQVWQRVE